MTGSGAGKPIRLRIHHGLCVCLFRPDELETPYTATMKRFTARLAQPDAVVRLITDSFDAVCGPCPHRAGKSCGKRGEVTVSDSRCQDLCGVELGQELPWVELKELLHRRILEPGKLLYACEGCEYLARCEGIRQSDGKRRFISF